MSTPILSLGNKTLEQLKVAELREELRKRGINIKGLKKDLVERLDEVLRQEAAKTEDQSNKTGREDVSDDEETSTQPDVVDVATEPMQQVALSGPECEAAVVGCDFSDSLRGVADLFNIGKEPNLFKQNTSVIEVELIDAGADRTRGLLPPSVHQTTPISIDRDSIALELAPLHAVDASDGGNMSIAEVQIEPGNDGGGKVDAGKVLEAKEKTISEIVDAKVEDDNVSNLRLQTVTEQVKPDRYSFPSSSTDTIILDSSGPKGIFMENPVVAVEVRRVIRTEEVDGSVTEHMRAEPTGTSTVETMSAVTETTVVTSETSVVNEAAANTFTARVEQEDRPFVRKSSDTGTLTVEVKDDEQLRNKLEGMDVEGDGKAKDLKSRTTDSESLTGGKRRIDESRPQEPSRRQRRWNSEKIAANADENTLRKVIPTEASKEMIGPEVCQRPQAYTEQPLSTTASSTPKASGSSNVGNLSPTRRGLSCAEVTLNGELDKNRFVPPTLRTPTISLKIDRFVRPFTIKAVRELLEQTGTVKEMWMDQIKTHCFVTFASVDDAVATRNALYHLQWPVAGGKLLVAEFVEPEEVLLRLDSLIDNSTVPAVNTSRDSANSSTQVISRFCPTPSAVPVPTPTFPPVVHLSSSPKERPVLLPRKEHDSPIPTLDDLYEKTRTKPQIYFLPLTEEQVAVKSRMKQTGCKAPLKT